MPERLQQQDVIGQIEARDRCDAQHHVVQVLDAD